MNKVLFKKGTVLIQTYCVLQCCPFVGIVNESILTESKHQIFCNCYGSVTFKVKEEFLVVVVGVLLLLCGFFFVSPTFCIAIRVFTGEGL